MFIFGLIFTFLIPLANTNDEPNHFIRANEVATLNLKYTTFKEALEKYPNITYATESFSACPEADNANYTDEIYNCKGVVVNESVINMGFFFSQNEVFNYAKPYDWHKFLDDASWMEYSNGKKVFVAARQTSTYAPIAYLPQALAFDIGIVLHLNTAVIAYLMRIFLLICSCIAGFFTINLIERKSTLKAYISLVFLLFPSVIQLSIAPGADAMSFWPMVLAFALLIYGDYSNNKTYALIIICSSISALSKPTMMAFAFLITLYLLMQNMPLIQKLKMSGLSIIPIILSFIWEKLSAVLSVETYAPYKNVSEHWEEMIKNDKVNFIYEFFGRLSNYFTLTNDHQLRGISLELMRFPMLLGQQDVPVPFFILIAVLIFIIILIVVNSFIGSRHSQKSIPYYLSIPIILIFFIGTAYIMLTISTPYDAENYTIYGFQSRYLLIIFPILLFTRFSNQNAIKFTNKIISKFNNFRHKDQIILISKCFITLFCISFLIFASIMIYIRYNYGLTGIFAPW